MIYVVAEWLQNPDTRGVAHRRRRKKKCTKKQGCQTGPLFGPVSAVQRIWQPWHSHAESSIAVGQKLHCTTIFKIMLKLSTPNRIEITSGFGGAIARVDRSANCQPPCKYFV